MSEIAERTLTHLVDAWFARFGEALAARDAAALSALFVADSYWRDAVALTWHLTTTCGNAPVVQALLERARAMQASGFAVDPARAAPRRVRRVGAEVVEALFKFETATGIGAGVVRLIPVPRDPSRLRAWMLFTSLEGLKGCVEPIGRHRPTGQSLSRDFRGPNWLDQRRADAAYADRDPVVLVVGGGHAGLGVAARLKMQGVDTLIIDREARIGDNWRNRYHALTLHNQVQVGHLPYVPYPATWPTYLPKDKLANWFEAYVEMLELNFWTRTELLRGGTYDDAGQRWNLDLRLADGSIRRMHPRHLVMATGANGLPVMPEVPGLADFGGKVVHSSGYGDGDDWTGRHAIVLGTGTSGHDIAQDLHGAGAHVTMVQRSPTLVMGIEPSGQLAYTLYDEGPSLDDCDLIAATTPTPLARKTHTLFTRQAKEYDREILAGLERAGFELDFGEDDTGWQFKFLTRGGGYYFNVGCSELIIAGEVKLEQHRDLERFEAGGMRMRDGRLVPADLVVCATGFLNQGAMLRHLFGDAIADRAGPVWGFGDELELRNMYMRTGHPGLWFIAGGLPQCRINSKYLALQIKAIEEGLIPLTRGA